MDQMEFEKVKVLVSPLWADINLKPTDAAILLITSAILSYPYWRDLCCSSTQIPNSFWHAVPQATKTQAQLLQQKNASRHIGHAFEQQDLDLVVFWGSQSGRAEVMARQFAKYLHGLFDLRVIAADLDDFDVCSLVELTETQRVVLLVSTYGDGDPPDNTNALWGFLHDPIRKHDLSALRYLIFGLGNSNYRQYNQVAKTVDDRLQAFGAVRLCNLGLGDDASGTTENDFLAWRRDVQLGLKGALNLTEKEIEYQPVYSIVEDASIDPKSVHLGQPWSNAPQGSQQRGIAPSMPVAAQVIRMQKLWETPERTCIQMDLDLGQDRRLKYKTGDHLSVLAYNPEHEVEQLLTRIGMESSRYKPIRINSNDHYERGRMPVPSPTTLDSLFRSYLEISSPVSLDMVNTLTTFAPSQVARQQLIRLYNDPAEFRAVVTSCNLTLAGLLRKFGGEQQWEIPVSLLLERLRPMQPRYYSIASSAVVEPDSLSIVAVVNKPPGKDVGTMNPANACYGMATSYLRFIEQNMRLEDVQQGESSVPYSLNGSKGLLTGHKVFCTTCYSSFKLPLKASSPVILVGAGTGIAPFRGFVQERVQQRNLGREVGKTLLFMGFRDSKTDFLYENDWKKWQTSLTADIFQYSVAFSRDMELKKQYVQDLIKDNGTEIMNLLEVIGCRFYICGSASMARAVVDTLVALRMTHAGRGQEEAVQWVKNLRKFNTLLEDVWG